MLSRIENRLDDLQASVNVLAGLDVAMAENAMARYRKAHPDWRVKAPIFVAVVLTGLVLAAGIRTLSLADDVGGDADVMHSLAIEARQVGFQSALAQASRADLKGDDPKAAEAQREAQRAGFESALDDLERSANLERDAFEASDDASRLRHRGALVAGLSSAFLGGLLSWVVLVWVESMTSGAQRKPRSRARRHRRND
jgi:hypothetical protein